MVDWQLVFELCIIFFSRILEVSMGTLRIILVNKGYRTPAVLLAFFEVLIWVFIASQVINGLSEQPIKGIVYSFGFALGVYAGSRLEGRLAFGQVQIQTITTVEKGEEITNYLRALGMRVTVVDASGKENAKKVLLVYANRRGHNDLIDLIKGIDEHAMVITNDVTNLHGGYLSTWRRFVK